jgi:4,5:9,10-diseco-3-hydroxy-5,9,17-trioxoandrosta-1(10),2-diene-4-oate hydrolase
MDNRQAIGVPADAEIVETCGVRLAVHRQGSGPAVVCLHAIGHGGRDFEAFAAETSDSFEVVRIDWPDHGRSGSDVQPPSARRYAELLGATLGKLQIRDPIIVGNSIGGAAAILYASQYLVRALVLCDSGGLVEVNRTLRTFCGMFARFFAAGERGARWFKPAFRAYYRFIVLPARPAIEQRRRIVEAGYELAGTMRRAWEGFAQPEADIRDIATALSLPVWFAWAEKDRVIPLSMCMPCIEKMQNAQVTKFKGGHAAFLEQPEEFAREFRRFAASLEAKSTKRNQLRMAQTG